MSVDNRPAKHHTESLRAADGTEIFVQSWQPGSVRAVLLLAHGFAEHSGRYGHLIEQLLEKDIAVYALDHRGHGQSSGAKGYISRFGEMVDDLHNIVGHVRSEQPGRKLILLGHSMGGLMSLRYTISHRRAVDLLMVSAPYLVDGGNVSPLLLKLSRVLATLTPWLPIKQLDATAISRDPHVVHDYDNDPLNFRGKVLARTGYELLTAGPAVLQQADQIELPILIMHGDADRIADVSGSQQLHERVSSADKSLRIYSGLYHEILNEPEKDQVVADIVQWLEQRI